MFAFFSFFFWTFFLLYQVTSINPVQHFVSHQLLEITLQRLFISSCATPSLHSHRFFFCSPIESLASPCEYLCPHGLTIKIASPCFHFLTHSGNPDQGLELWSSLQLQHVSLLPVIGDYIRLGNKDILGCRGSDELPCRHPREWNNWTFHSDADGRRSCWHSETSLCTNTALEIWIILQIIQRSITTLILAFLCHFSGYLSLKFPDLKVLVSCLHVLVWLCGFHRFG